MQYACFLQFRHRHGSLWEFQYMANNERERDDFIARARNMMDARMLGSSVLGYNVVGLSNVQE